MLSLHITHISILNYNLWTHFDSRYVCSILVSKISFVHCTRHKIVLNLYARSLHWFYVSFSILAIVCVHFKIVHIDNMSLVLIVLLSFCAALIIVSNCVRTKIDQKKNEPEARKHCAHLLTCANSRQSYYVCAVNGKCLFSFGQINMDFICFWDLLLFYSVEILFVNVKHFGMSNGCSGKMQSNRGKKYFVSVFFVLFLWS